MSIVSRHTLCEDQTVQNLAESIDCSTRGFLAIRNRKFSSALYKIIRETNSILAACLAPTGEAFAPSSFRAYQATAQEFYAEGMRKAAVAISYLLQTQRPAPHSTVFQLLETSIQNLDQVEKNYLESRVFLSRPIALVQKTLENLSVTKLLVGTLADANDALLFNQVIAEIESLQIDKIFFPANTDRFYAKLDQRSPDLRAQLVYDLLSSYLDLLFIAGGDSSTPTYQLNEIISRVSVRIDQLEQKFDRLEVLDIQNFQLATGCQIYLLNEFAKHFQYVKPEACVSTSSRAAQKNPKIDRTQFSDTLS